MATKKIRKQIPWQAPTTGNNYSIMATIYDLYDLMEIKLPPSEKWSLIVDQHKLTEEFSTGLLGKTGFQLLEIIAKIYTNAEEHRKPKTIKRANGEKELVSFFGDELIIENINVDMTKKEVSIRFDTL